MCLLLFSLNPDASEDQFYLVLVNVRDEFYHRPTKLAHEWRSNLNIIGGMDIEPGKEGGTWLAMSKTGRLASLLNILQPDEEISSNKKGRGFLVVNYVNKSDDCLTYLEHIQNEKDSYNGFTLVTMDFSSLTSPKAAYFTNLSSQPPEPILPGIHAFGNSTDVERPWPKVKRAKELFSEIVGKYLLVADKDVLVESLFNLLSDTSSGIDGMAHPSFAKTASDRMSKHVPGMIAKMAIIPGICFEVLANVVSAKLGQDMTSMLLSGLNFHVDENMERQGKSKPRSFMEKLSSIFVQVPDVNYGSRCHTIILIDGSGQVEYIEKSRSETAEDQWTLQKILFKLNP